MVTKEVEKGFVILCLECGCEEVEIIEDYSDCEEMSFHYFSCPQCGAREYVY